MIIVFLALQTFVFRWDIKEKLFDAISTNVSKDKQKSEITKTFWISILTSWISPCSVWINNRSYNKDYKHLRFHSMEGKFNIFKKTLSTCFTNSRDRSWIMAFCIFNRKYFLLICSFTSITTLLVWIVILNFILRNMQLTDIQSFPPITHCFHLHDDLTLQGQCYLIENGTLTENVTSCIYLCYSTACSTVVRSCLQGEKESDVFYYKLSYILFCLICLSLLASCCLQILGDYEVLFKFTSFMRLPIVHFSYIKDCLNAKLQHSARNSRYFQTKENRPSNTSIDKFYNLALKKQLEWDERITKLIEIGGKNVLKKRDPCTGENLLHTAYQKLCFVHLKQMIRKVRGNHTSNIFKTYEIQNGTIFQAQIFTWVEDVVELKIILTQEEVTPGSVCEIQMLVNGRYVPHSFQQGKTFNISKIQNYICLIRETLDGIGNMRKGTKYTGKDNDNWIMWQKIWFFYNTANFPSSISNQQVEKINKVWRIPPLHMAVKDHKRKLFLFFVWLLGVRMEGKDENNLTAYQYYLRCTKEITAISHNGFFWDLMQAGGEAFAETEEEKSLTAEIIYTTVSTKKRSALTLSNTTSHLVRMGDIQKLDNVIARGKFLHDAEKQSPLHVAVQNNNLTCLRALLSKQTDIVNSRNMENKTPLHIACEKQNHEAVLMLLDLNADVNIAEKSQKRTSVHLAAIWGDGECFRRILENKADINSKDISGNTPLHFAIKNNNVECLRLLIESKAELQGAKINSLHFMAAGSGNLVISQMLLDNGVEIDEKSFLYSVEIGNFKLVKFFLSHNADINSRNEFWETGLHLAAQGGHFEIVKLLIENNANVAALNQLNKTPLHYLTSPSDSFEIENLVQCCELLLAAGVDSRIRDHNSSTPIQLAAHHGLLELVRILLPYKQASNLRTTLLHDAILNCQEKCLKFLLDENIDIDACDVQGSTALHYAAMMGHFSMLSMVMEKGVELNTINIYGETALHLALKYMDMYLDRDYVKCCEHLILSGADLNIKNCHNQTPLEILHSKGLMKLYLGVNSVTQNLQQTTTN